jgi:hypothetical protein
LVEFWEYGRNIVGGVHWNQLNFLSGLWEKYLGTSDRQKIGINYYRDVLIEFKSVKSVEKINK